jgi:hypothetical protein
LAWAPIDDGRIICQTGVSFKCQFYDKETKTMKWVTRSHVHVDRIACPWLITRFIDSEAEFLFVPASQIEQVAKETGAIPFDAPGVELGHHGGDGTAPGTAHSRPLS